MGGLRGVAPSTRGLERISSDLLDVVICAVARELRDEQVVAFGLHAEQMLGAALLAQKLHAPGLRIRHGLRAERGVRPGPAAWTDDIDDQTHKQIEYREAHDAILRVANPLSPMRFCDVFFVGGLQIDVNGNTNLIGLRGDGGRMKLRGPGSIGTTSIGTLAPDLILFSWEHSPRRFVEAVDYVSVPGWDRRQAAGLEGGPRLCITSMAVMAFQEGRMRLRSVHPGVTAAEVRAATGFDLGPVEEVPTTTAPTDAETAALQEIGVAGVAAEGGPSR